MPLVGLTTTNDCGSYPSSIAKLHLIKAGEVTSMTKDVSEWSEITLTSGSIWKEYQFRPFECELQINPVVEGEANAWQSTITFRVGKLSPTNILAIDELRKSSYCGIIAVAENFNGDRWVIGYDEILGNRAGLMLQAGTFTSGRGQTGQQGGDVILMANLAVAPLILAAEVELVTTV